MDSNQYLSDNFSGLIEGVRGNNDAGRGESRVYHGDFRNNFVKIALSSTWTRVSKIAVVVIVLRSPLFAYSKLNFRNYEWFATTSSLILAASTYFKLRQK